jgi:hypothetical protein
MIYKLVYTAAQNPQGGPADLRPRTTLKEASTKHHFQKQQEQDTKQSYCNTSPACMQLP